VLETSFERGDSVFKRSAVIGEKRAFRISKKLGRDLATALLIIPALLPLIVLIFIPAFRTLFMSFNRMTFGLPDEYVGLNNFRDMLRDSVFNSAFWNTIMFSFTTVAGEICVGMAAAVLMSTRFRFQRISIALIMIPYAVSEVVAVIIWKYMLEPDVGILNYVIHGMFGLEQINWASIPAQAWVVIILLRIWINFPFSFLIIYSSIIGISSELYESVYIDGANNWQGFRYITLPLTVPAVMVASIFGFVFAFRNFATVWIMTRGGPMNKTELLSTLLYKQAFTYWEFGAASAIAVTMTLITFLIAAYYLRTMYKEMFLKQK
jgi:multiple sugar transport system permease protein